MTDAERKKAVRDAMIAAGAAVPGATYADLHEAAAVIQKAVEYRNAQQIMTNAFGERFSKELLP